MAPITPVSKPMDCVSKLHDEIDFHRECSAYLAGILEKYSDPMMTRKDLQALDDKFYEYKKSDWINQAVKVVSEYA